MLYGPHGAPDFFTPEYIDMFFASRLGGSLQFQSDRRPADRSRSPIGRATDGGEAGLHPTNIHDNAYAIGTIDFTGDMPIILGPDGPSLGGFVCPVDDRAGRALEDGSASSRATKSASARLLLPRPARLLAQAERRDRDARVRSPRRRFRMRSAAPTIASSAAARPGDKPRVVYRRAGEPIMLGRIRPDRARFRAALPRACSDDQASSARSCPASST